MTRGKPVIEAILDRGLPYASGPQWLAENVLDRQVGARGRRHARQEHDRLDARVDPRQRRLDPGFLIGGIARNFHVSALRTGSPSS
jgi:UDP-N-acetylmuramate: L-alanyl-gamma-D-glutamyl-meso-diaminopimelate ligase